MMEALKEVALGILLATPHSLRYEIFGNAQAGALLERLTAFDQIMKG